MRKPEGYDEAVVFNNRRLPIGAYEIQILDAVVREESSLEKLVLRFDISNGEYKGFFQKDFEQQNKQDSSNANWKGVFKQLTSGKSVVFFKKLIQTIEASNSGYKFNFDENTLKGKKIGMVFDEIKFTSKKTGKPSSFVGAVEAITIADLESGNFEIPSKSQSKKNDDSSKSDSSSANNNMVDNKNYDDIDIPF